MNKKIFIVAVFIVGIVFLLALLFPAPLVKNGEQAIGSPLNATYLIDEKPVTLVGGKAEVELIPGSATKLKVSNFGEPVYGDIDSDGDQDAVLLLVSDTGGSGTFYYATLAINVSGSYRGTDTILLGDRIAPQTYYFQGNKAIVNYADRPFGAPFTTQPSEGKSLYLQYDPSNFRLIQVAVDFEGEADPDRMTLDMTTWKWIRTVYNDGTIITPQKPEAFSLTLRKDGTVSIKTDCNTMSGKYTVSGKNIVFKDVATTLMYYEGSQEQVFSSMLGNVQSFLFTSRGELILELKFDSGSIIFR
jgi:heat shock protein HslJ